MSSIEKMMFADIAGIDTDLDAVLDIISSCGCFHMENAAAVHVSGSKQSAKRENPYTASLKLLAEIGTLTGIKLCKADCSDIRDSDAEKVRTDIRSIRNRVQKLKAEIKKASDNLNAHTMALEQVLHLSGGEGVGSLSVDIEQIFACKHIKVRFGRLPTDSYEKLSYYEDKNFYFLAYGRDKEYVYGFCFAPLSEAEEIDNILESLYFDRIRLPDFVHGSADDAAKSLEKNVEEDKAEVEKRKKELADYIEQKRETLNKYFTKLKTMHDTFELREKVMMIRDKFYIVGFVPERDAERFKKYFEDLKSVSLVMKPCTENGEIETPVKLRNNKFAEPFSMFVDLYGLPAYNDINPTNFVAITYTLLFGIMFGDLGQGLVISLLGLLLWKWKKMTLGRIMERLGVSSMIFGTLYGSVFGYEELLDPMYESLGISFLPFKAIHSINNVLYSAIGIGIFIIIISVIVNMVMGLKEKNYTRALFSNNGLAGLVFYCSLLMLLLGGMLGLNVGGTAYVLCLIVLPLIVMFLREPLGDMVKGKGFHIHESLGDFIAANFFECFEFLLGYATNTLSFVRVGGFVLSHAGMMSVVLALAEMSGGMSPVVMILGNLFVIVLEGLLVGIQVLRLEFYEMFSRYYTGGGKAFKPVSVNYDEIIE
ncbi:MAG: V-type ATPase 116kDa subunit family protein [Oscillospiraceae bacterium]|nr:V-type ATPase 116kDa subunit family protein [Oscillospiraceae bacterium]MDY6208484.1 V-type ATPase 116kDa subunit family protein [Oscillospiraceae bacterium]